MDQNIDEKIKQTLSDIKKYFDDEKQKLTLQKEEVMKATKNKLELDAYANQLKEKEENLVRREKEVQVGIEKNRDRTRTLELKEKQFEEKNERLKTTIRNLNLE